MVRFLHTSDWQLGMRRHFLDTDAQARFDQARIDAIRSIGTVATQSGCAFIVAAGDIFESNHLQPRTIARTIEALRDLPIPTFLLPGNHDPLDPSSVFMGNAFAGSRPANVHVLTGEPATPIHGVEVHGVPWRSKRPTIDHTGAYAAALPPPNGNLRVLVAHGGVTSLAMGRIDPTLIDEEPLDRAFATNRLHYVALGDRHSTFSVGSSGRTWYSGAPEPTDYDEDDPGNVLVVELNEATCAVTPHRVGTWRFLPNSADLNSGSDLDALERWLDGLPAKERTILKLSFSGTLSLDEHARLLAILENARHAFAAIENREAHDTLAVAPAEEDLENMSLGGYARETLQQLLAESRSSSPGARIAHDALTLLYRLAGSRP